MGRRLLLFSEPSVRQFSHHNANLCTSVRTVEATTPSRRLTYVTGNYDVFNLVLRCGRTTRDELLSNALSPHCGISSNKPPPFQLTMVNVADERASYQTVFALDVITAVISLTLLGLASRPTFLRIKARKFSTPGKYQSDQDAPLKTTLGTYLFLWPALLCYLVAYTTRFISDLLKTNGTIDYDADLSWNGRTAYRIDDNEYGTSISALSFTTTLATIFFTILLNGGVWIHSSHVQSNGTGISTPKKMSKMWNAFIMLLMLATGLAAWGRGMAVRDVDAGSSGPSSMMSWSNVLHHDRVTRILYIVHECIVVAASLSVTIEVLREYNTTNKHSHEVCFLSRIILY
jgi:hypothetical protein